MYRNVLEYLENSTIKFGNKTAFSDDKTKITFTELMHKAMAVGSAVADVNGINSPIVVYLPKSVDCITAFLGAVYAGGFYCPIDVKMPLDRVNLIFGVLNPSVIITSQKYKDKIAEIAPKCKIILIEQAVKSDINKGKLDFVRRNMTDTDPLYTLFTSGSTGVPKGVAVSHRAVIDFAEWVTEKFDITSEDVLGNQGNFYFDLSVLDIYGGLKNGAEVCIIPQKKFIFPVDLLNYLNEKHITIINWVPSMLCNVANMNALDAVKPLYLKKVLFCGEVMPTKQLNVWRNHLPDLLYVNLYGPTETVYACTYYIVNRDFADDEMLPIGNACENTKIIVLNENDELVQGDEMGELCVAGTCLALGYYNNPEKTHDAFVQNPANKRYNEEIYRTGDIVKYNSYGELMYLSRKDFQIKHLGHRIELGEIETAIGGIPTVDDSVCVYDDLNKEICVCYTGTEISKKEFIDYLKEKIPSYMIPSKFFYMDQLPHNANGKIDRISIKKKINQRTVL